MEMHQEPNVPIALQNVANPDLTWETTEQFTMDMILLAIIILFQDHWTSTTKKLKIYCKGPYSYFLRI